MSQSARVPPPPRLSLARTTIASVAADALLAASSLVAVPYLVSRLGAERYGIFALITVLAGQLVGLHVGLGWAAPRRVAETRATKGVSPEATVRAVLLLALAASMVVAAAFALVATLAWTRAFRGPADVLRAALATVPAGIVIAGVQPALQGLHGILYGQERFLLVVRLRLVHGVARLGAAVAAVALGGGVLATLWSQAAVDLLIVLVTLAIILRGTRGRPAKADTASEVRVLVATGVPFAVAGIFAALLTDVEKLAIGMARSVEDFTYYSVPFNAILRLSVFAVALASVLAPRLSSLRAGDELAAAVGLARRAVRVSVAGMALLVAPVLAVVPELLRLWLGAGFAARSTLLTRILLVALLPRTLAYVAESVLRASARPVVFTILYALELPLHLVAVYVFVRGWGVQGAALAWTLRVALDAAAQWQMARRALGAPLGRAAETLGPALMLALLAGGCQALDHATTPWVRLAVGLLVGGAIVLRQLSLEDWQIFKRLFQLAP